MNTSLLSDIVILVAAYSLGLGLSVMARTILSKESLLDHPNERSMHNVAVPRGGGLVLIIVLVPGMILAALNDHVLPVYSGLIFGTMLLAGISWRDDRVGAHPALRLSMHILAASIGSLAFGSQAMIFGGYLPFWLDRTVMIIGWTWFINLYNFMDGIDGLTGIETMFVAGGVCLIAAIANVTEPFSGVLILLLTGSCLGFLSFNWHPAKMFLGDVGSVPLGYLTGFLLIMLAVKGLCIPAFILALYYIADSGLTLAVRIVRREKFWQPHRQHFYQRAAKAVIRHDKVVWWIVTVNTMLLALSGVAVFYPWRSLAAALLIVALLLKKLHKAAGITG